MDRVPGLARKLVSRRPDVLMAGPFDFVSALKQETTTIYGATSWMNGASIRMRKGCRMGFITSLAQPGAIVTGVQGAAYSPPETFKIAEEGRQIAASAPIRFCVAPSQATFPSSKQPNLSC